MALALVQETAQVSGSNSISMQLAVTPTAGHALFVPVAWLGGTNIDTSISDDVGTITWHTAVTSANEFGARTRVFYTYDIPAQGVNTTVTVTRIGGGTITIRGHLAEWSGFTGNDPLSATASHKVGNVANADTGTSGTTGEDEALIFAVVQQSTVSAVITVESVSPSWTQVWESTPFGGRAESDYRLVAVKGTQICHWTFSANSNYSACLAAFVAAATPTAGVRATQAVQTVVSQADPSPVRLTQAVQGLVVAGDLALRLTQVVQTIIVNPAIAPGPIVIPTPTNTNAWKLLRFDLKKRDEEEV